MSGPNSDLPPGFDALLDACAEDVPSRARTVAFALVTAYDHEVSDLEVDRYVSSLQGDGEAFRALALAMKRDLDGATVWSRGYLADARTDAAQVAEIVQAARSAAVADERLTRREEVALHLVAVAVGMDPSEL